MAEAHGPKVPPAGIVRAVEKVRAGLQKINQRMVPAPIALLEIITASWMTQAVNAAAELGIADILKDGPRSVEDIAKRASASSEAVGRLLRLLASRGIFTQLGDGRFALTALAEPLRSDSPTSMRAFAMFVGNPDHWQHWGQLPNSVRTGKVSVPDIRGMGYFEYLETNPRLAKVFNDAMTSVSDLAKGPVLAAYDFSRFSKIVDIAGGYGRFLASILRQAPRAHGILFDLPSVTAGAPKVLQEEGVADRCAIESGSFFDSVPKGGDAYVLKHIIHDWEEAKALAILRSVRSAIPPSGVLLVVEMVLPEGNAPHFGKQLDMEMLLSVGGKERTAKEYAELLTRAGFRQTRVIQTAAPISIVEAVPAPS